MGCLSLLLSQEPRHVIWRPYIVYGSSAFLLLSVFFFFVLFGWPGGPIGCIYKEPHDGCYCEAFNMEDVEGGSPGVRQPVNTWSSLFSLVTSATIAWFMSEDRRRLFEDQEPQNRESSQHSRRGSSFAKGSNSDQYENESMDNNNESKLTNVMRSNNLIADWYVLTAVWEGLGKMYFHGSLVRWATYVDGVSSNFFYAYLPWYTFRRIYQSENADSLFWLGYFVTVTIISSLQIYFGSLLAAHMLLIFYFFMELYIFATTGVFLGKSCRSKCTWFLAFGLFLVAAGFWWASQTGRVMCDPESPWQIHGLVWHPTVCVVMVLLYFYWRGAEDPTIPVGEADESTYEGNERKQSTYRIANADDFSL